MSQSHTIRDIPVRTNPPYTVTIGTVLLDEYGGRLR